MKQLLVIGCWLLVASARPITFEVDAGGRIPSEAGQTISTDWAVFTFQVAGVRGNAESVQLVLDLVHTWDEDLEIVLSHTVNGVTKEAKVFNQQIGGPDRFDNFDATVFADNATMSITDILAQPPYAGRFKPVEAFSVFRGINPNGQWELKVFDHRYGDYGWLYKNGDPPFENRRGILDPSPHGSFFHVCSDSFWPEDFDCYAPSSQLIGQGGWDGWDGNTNANATVVSDLRNSWPNSVKITGSTDVVRSFTGYTTGRWVFKDKWYVSSASVGDSYLILLNKYLANNHDLQHDWSVILRARASDRTLTSTQTGGSLPLVLDDWADVRVEVDLDANSARLFYNGQFLTAHPWAPQGGQHEIAAVDLYSDNSSSLSYHDDLDLVAGPVNLNPTSFSVFRGTLESGALSDLLTSDDLRVIVRNGATALASESPITLLLDGTCPTQTAETLGMLVENHVSLRGLKERIDMFDYVAGTYVNVYTGDATLADSVAYITPASPNRFIETGTKAIKSRLRIRFDGPALTNTWRSYTDQWVWLYTAP